MKHSLLLVSLSLLACGPAPTPQPVKPTQLTLATTGTLSVELLTFAPLTVGQNRVFYRVKNEGAEVPHAEMVQHPVMQMETMKHACPLQNPDHMPNADGLYEGLIVFTMASSEMDVWSLTLDVALSHDGLSQRVDFGAIAVGDSTMKKVVTRDGKKIVLSLGYPQAPHVGSNPVVVTAHQATDMTMMDFSAVGDLTFTLTSEMPSMGHGASGNVSPVRGDDGLYRGTAIFSMAGDWVVHLGVSAGETALDQFDFAVDL